MEKKLFFSAFCTIISTEFAVIDANVMVRKTKDF